MPLSLSDPRNALLAALLLGAAACSTQTQSAQPAGAPPTPVTISQKNPGGDADDPEGAALTRLITEPWGFRRDFWNSLHIPLVDWKNWKRVKTLGYQTRATHRYGDSHYAVSTIWYTTIEGPNEPEACLAKFTDEAMPVAESFGVRVGDRERLRLQQTIGADVKPVVVEIMEGRLDGLFGHDDYVGAVAAYQSFPGTCLVQGFAVVSTNHRDLAIRVRDRWVTEGAKGLTWEKNVKEAPETLSR